MQDMDSTNSTDLNKKSRILFFSVITTFVSLFPTFYVALLSNSVTLYADFLRCFGEFLSIAMSWLIFRKISKPQSGDYSYGFGKLEQFASLSVGIAMILTFLTAMTASISRFVNPVPLDDAMIGIIFTVLSIGGNLFIWLSNHRLNSTSPSPILYSQARLFRAKTIISFVVLISLCLSTFSDQLLFIHYADPIGSMLIALFLLYSAVGVLSSSIHDLLDKSLSEVVQFKVLKALVAIEDDYTGFVNMRSRLSGGQVYIEIFLEFSPNKTINEVLTSIARIKIGILKAIPGADICIVIS